MKSRSAKGDFDASGIRFGLVASRFNEEIVARLVEGAEQTIEQCGGELGRLVWVPGAFELPLMAKRLAASGAYDAIVCMGAVIRGETAHFDFVAGQAAQGIMQVGLETGIPVMFSVLTTDTWEQAEARIDKGGHGVLSAIEMVELLREEELCDLKS